MRLKTRNLMKLMNNSMNNLRLETLQAQLEDELNALFPDARLDPIGWGATNTLRDMFNGVTNDALQLGGRLEEFYWFTSSGNPTFKQGGELFASHFAHSMLGNQQHLNDIQQNLSGAYDVLNEVIVDMARILRGA